MFAVELRNPILWLSQTGQVWFKTILGLDMTALHDNSVTTSVG